MNSFDVVNFLRDNLEISLSVVEANPMQSGPFYTELRVQIILQGELIASDSIEVKEIIEDYG